jgi:hypothetical protein
MLKKHTFRQGKHELVYHGNFLQEKRTIDAVPLPQRGLPTSWSLDLLKSRAGENLQVPAGTSTKKNPKVLMNSTPHELALSVNSPPCNHRVVTTGLT